MTGKKKKAMIAVGEGGGENPRPRVPSWSRWKVFLARNREKGIGDEYPVKPGRSNRNLMKQPKARRKKKETNSRKF